MSTRAPSPRFARVLLETTQHPKFIGDDARPPLSAAQRGTWITALVLANITYPNAVHESAVRLQAPGAEFAELYERGLLERTDDPGWFHVHDLPEHYRSPSADPDAVAERVRRHRANKKRPVTAVTDETTDQTNETNETDNRVDSPERTQAHAGRGRATKVRGFARPFEATS